MREIKYKACWHESKLMTNVDTIEFLNDGTRVSDGCMHTGWLGKDCELLQYTGLKDKNGVEIYEGDIVQAFSQGVKGNFEVKWRQEGSPGWVLFPAWQSSQMWHLHAIETEKGQYQDSVTVIGNRYENPELLEETK